MAFSLAVSMVGTISSYVLIMVSIVFYLILKGNAMNITTMFKSVIGGVLVLVGLLVQTAPTMISYGNLKKLELDLG